MIKISLSNINVKNKSKYFNLLGDKAYKTKEIIKLNEKLIKIITPYKKNGKNKNSKSHNEKLKKRRKIENVINNLKNMKV